MKLHYEPNFSSIIKNILHDNNQYMCQNCFSLNNQYYSWALANEKNKVKYCLSAKEAIDENQKIIEYLVQKEKDLVDKLLEIENNPSQNTSTVSQALGIDLANTVVSLNDLYKSRKILTEKICDCDKKKY